MTRGRLEAGFSLVELLVASAIMLVVTGAVFQVMDPAQGTFQAQPEVSDLQQRVRVATDTISHDLLMAGAGTYVGNAAGALYNFFAPVMPYRRGDTGDDPSNGVYYRPDTITILYVPPTPAQTGVIQALGNDGISQEIKVEAQKNCGPSAHDRLCGFSDGMRTVIYDIDGTWDLTTITTVQDEAVHLQHSGKLSGSYDSGDAVITEVKAHTYYLKSDPATSTYQLMHYDGYLTDAPVVDNVVSLAFEYYGEAQPPRLLPGKSLASAAPPWTTYGPKPPVLGTDLKNDDEWGAGENCVFQVSGGQQVSRLPVLASGLNQVLLTQAQLTDGPWCPSVDSPARFDADLLRIRRVRVTVRVQVAQAALRGPAGTLFSKGGTSRRGERYVPDQEISFDVAPRNMNLGR